MELEYCNSRNFSLTDKIRVRTPNLLTYWAVCASNAGVTELANVGADDCRSPYTLGVFQLGTVCPLGLSSCVAG